MDFCTSPSITLSTQPPLTMGFVSPPGFPVSSFSFSVTGSNPINPVNVTASGATNVLLNGNTLLISSTLSGGSSTGNFDPAGTAQATGIILYGYINGLSGALTGEIGSLSGFTLTLSGYGTNTYSTIVSLQTTGQNLYNYIIELSGQINSALTQSGIIIENQINSLSGFTTTLSGILYSQIYTGGVYSVNSISGNINLVGTGNPINNIIISTDGISNIFISGTGIAQQNDLNNFSGFVTTNFDSSGTAASTGNILYQDIQNVSGMLAASFNDPLTKKMGNYLYISGSGFNLPFNIQFGSGDFSIFFNTYLNTSGHVLTFLGGAFLDGGSSGFEFGTTSSNRLQTRVANGAQAVADFNRILPSGTWFNAGYVRSSALGMGMIYYNGNLDITGVDINNYSGNSRIIGGNLAINVNFNGYINDLVIYSGLALSQQQINNLIFAGTDPSLPAPIMDYTDGVISGNIWYDRSPNANHAQLSGRAIPVLFDNALAYSIYNYENNFSPYLVNTLNNYLYFNGTGIVIPPMNFGSGDFSVILDTYPLLTGGQTMGLLGTSGASSGFQLVLTSTNKVATDFAPNTLVSNTALNKNQWYNISYVRAGGTGNIYINGILDTFSSNVNQNYSGYTNYIGVKGNNNVGLPFTGFLKNAIIYSGTGLSPQQINNLLMYGPSPLIPSTIDYTNGIISGTILYDRSINGNNAVVPATVIPILFDNPTITQIINTGNNLYQIITGLSGSTNNLVASVSGFATRISGAISANINSLSGFTTGASGSLYNLILGGTGTGNVFITGQTLTTSINALSGWSQTRGDSLTLNTASLTWTNMPAAINFFNASSLYTTFMDLTLYTGARLIITQTTAGASTGALYLGFTQNYNTTPANWTGLNSDGVYTKINVANTVVNSGYHPIKTQANGPVYLALLGSGGSAAVSPIFGHIRADFM